MMTLAKIIRGCAVSAAFLALASCDNPEPIAAGRTASEWGRCIARDESMAQELLALGDAGLPVWYRLTESDSVAVRRCAGDGLIHLWRETHINAVARVTLFRRMLVETDSSIRTTAVRGLVRHLGPMEPDDQQLLAALRAGDEGLVDAACSEVALRLDPPRGVLRVLAEISDAMKSPRIKVSAALLAHGQAAPRWLGVATSALRSPKTGAEDRLSLLSAFEASVRSAAAAEQDLVELVTSSPDAMTRRRAAQALCQLEGCCRTEATRTSLQNLLELDESVWSDVECLRVRVLGIAPDRTRLATAREAKDPAIRLRAVLLEMTVEGAHPETEVAIRQALQSSIAGLRGEALRGLRRLGTKALGLRTDVARMSREERDWAVFQEAARTLRVIDERQQASEVGSRK